MFPGNDECSDGNYTHDSNCNAGDDGSDDGPDSADGNNSDDCDQSDDAGGMAGDDAVTKPSDRFHDPNWLHY